MNEEEIVVQVRLDDHWQKATRYEGEDPTKAHALAKQLVSEAQCDEVRILHGHYDASKQKLVYHQLFTSGQLVRSASLPEKQIPPKSLQQTDARPPSSPQQERLDSRHHVPQSADDARAPVDQSQPRNPSSRPRSRKKMIGVGVAAGVVFSGIGAAVYAWEIGTFEDPKVTGYGVLTIEGGGTGTCVEDEGVKSTLSALVNNGKITGIQTSSVRVTKGLDDVFVKLKMKECNSFFGLAASIKLISDGLTRDHRKFATGDWVGKHNIYAAGDNNKKIKNVIENNNNEIEALKTSKAKGGKALEESHAGQYEKAYGRWAKDITKCAIEFMELRDAQQVVHPDPASTAGMVAQKFGGSLKIKIEYMGEFPNFKTKSEGMELGYAYYSNDKLVEVSMLNDICPSCGHTEKVYYRCNGY